MAPLPPKKILLRIPIDECISAMTSKFEINIKLNTKHLRITNRVPRP